MRCFAPLEKDRGAYRVFVTKSGDRKSTRLNSSHVRISYAVFCLKKKITDLASEQLAPLDYVIRAKGAGQQHKNHHGRMRVQHDRDAVSRHLSRLQPAGHILKGLF